MYVSFLMFVSVFLDPYPAEQQSSWDREQHWGTDELHKT